EFVDFLAQLGVRPRPSGAGIDHRRSVSVSRDIALESGDVGEMVLEVRAEVGWIVSHETPFFAGGGCRRNSDRPFGVWSHSYSQVATDSMGDGTAAGRAGRALLLVSRAVRNRAENGH